MSRESVWKRSCIVAGTVFALFIGIVIMFLVLESSEASANKLAGLDVPLKNTADVNRLTSILNSVDKDTIVTSLKFYTDKPHIAGTPRDKVTAEYTAQKWRDVGIPNVDIEELSVRLSYIKQGAVVVHPQSQDDFSLDLDEPLRDGASENPPTMIGYSGSGTFSAPLVYCNYGSPADFKVCGDLAKGAIVLIRYGRAFRGNKVANAEAAGAVGVLLYSDPADDGPKYGKAYPDGPWRGDKSVQRGSAYMFGDPFTPGFGSAGKYPPRLQEKDLFVHSDKHWALPKIVVLPLSAYNARLLMRQIQGRAVPDATLANTWVGELGVEYRMGGTDDLKVTMTVEMDNPITPIYNVVGRIDGGEEDAPVILGNHRDAWSYGAVDPSSGSAVLDEVARVLGKAHNDGWRPRRTILFCSWDAEEYGLIGSTEFVERRRVELGRSAIAYLNVDSACAGHTRVEVSAIPSLSTVLREVAKLIPYMKPPGAAPSGGKTAADMEQEEEWAVSWQHHDTLLDFWNHTQSLSVGDVTHAGVVESFAGHALPAPGMMGSGTDYASFLQQLGVPSTDMGFGFAHFYGAYHSNDDNFVWMERFGDPGWTRHQMVAKWWAGVAFRLSHDLILPFDFVEYAAETAFYVGKVKAHAANGLANAASVSGDIWLPLDRAVADFRTAAVAVTHLQSTAPRYSDAAIRSLNRRLAIAERAFLDRREVFAVMRHTLFRPSRTNAYAGAALPSLYEKLNAYAANATDDALFDVAFEIRVIAATIDEVASILRPELLAEREEL